MTRIIRYKKHSYVDMVNRNIDAYAKPHFILKYIPVIKNGKIALSTCTSLTLYNPLLHYTSLQRYKRKQKPSFLHMFFHRYHITRLGGYIGYVTVLILFVVYSLRVGVVPAFGFLMV